MSNIYLRGSGLASLLEPDSESIRLTDIAHALSRIPRFTGHIDSDHCDDFTYTVAQHSVVVSKLTPTQCAFEGLMHDAAEAYVNDLSTPLKRLVGRGYTDIEFSVHCAVAERFGLPIHMSDGVARADKRAVDIEAHELFPDGGSSGGGFVHHGHDLGLISPMGMDDARRLFLDRFIEIRGMESYADHLIESIPLFDRAICLVMDSFRGTGSIDGSDDILSRMRHVIVAISRYSVSPALITAGVLFDASRFTELSMGQIDTLGNARVTAISCDLLNDDPHRLSSRPVSMVMSALDEMDSVKNYQNLTSVCIEC